MPLTARFVRTVKPQHRARRYNDQHGLLLAVQPTGSKQWLQRLTIAGKRCDIGLGSYPYIKLAEARTRAIMKKAEVMRGHDPRTPKPPRFGELAAEYEAIHSREWSPNTARNKRSHLKALAPLARMHVDGIRPEDCLRILGPMYRNGTSAARPIRALLRSILNFAVSKGALESNPAGEALDAAPTDHQAPNEAPRSPTPKRCTSGLPEAHRLTEHRRACAPLPDADGNALNRSTGDAMG